MRLEGYEWRINHRCSKIIGKKKKRLIYLYFIQYKGKIRILVNLLVGQL